ncbi:MAG: hypothetical protein SO179_00555 [Bacteroidales bacterium]|nr:hypothetical protein [Bacteroidales bacterium]
MNKFRITYPNNKEVREYKSRTTKKGNFVTKIGYSHKIFQDLTQNGVHKWVPFGRQQYYLDYSEFKTGFYNYSGYNNPYSLY